MFFLFFLLCKGRVIAPKKTQVVQQQKLKKVSAGLTKVTVEQLQFVSTQLLQSEFNTEGIREFEGLLNFNADFNPAVP